MKKKFDFGYVLPVLAGVVAILTGINEKRAQDRNNELEQKLDALNKRLEEKEE